MRFAEKNGRHFGTHFEATNFRNVCIMETIGLIFVASKVMDGLRYFRTFNTIILTLTQSGNLMVTFLSVLIFFNIMLIPLAQSIWGTKL